MPVGVYCDEWRTGSLGATDLDRWTQITCRAGSGPATIVMRRHACWSGTFHGPTTTLWAKVLSWHARGGVPWRVAHQAHWVPHCVKKSASLQLGRVRISAGASRTAPVLDASSRRVETDCRKLSRTACATRARGSQPLRRCSARRSLYITRMRGEPETLDTWRLSNASRMRHSCPCCS